MNGQGASAPAAGEQRRERDNLALEVVAGPCKTKEAFMAKGASITVGRTKKSTLHLQDSSISERHAILEWVNVSWTIRDLGSSNGTQVNGRDVQPAAEDADGRIRLQAGDLIRLGTRTFLQVTIGPPVPHDMTVEQYLEFECNMLVQRIQARSKFLQQDLRGQAEQLKTRLRQAMPAVS
ncbi:hypothetical protein KFL_002280140 [Klebsormidium nitens]|uniref:FHA domain-containing protein n=1 Tax=Klebsormidium nitens TaxID=105231 RepID=A0A1Y1I794_KLENI|nr:hypothetical protein KFL_002280140 [Klebsormidium nitens]|eukprot:GAQ85299.1 hypothetical protein KFL_002280140 [Klebsormidium nitens]